MRWENSSKDWSTEVQETEKRKLNVLRSLYRESKGAWKMYNFNNCLCKLWIWFTTKINKVKLIFLSTIKLKKLLSLEPNPSAVISTYPWLIWPRWVCAADLGWWPFYPLEFWTGCLFGMYKGWWRAVNSYIFGTTIFFLKFFPRFEV